MCRRCRRWLAHDRLSPPDQVQSINSGRVKFVFGKAEKRHRGDPPYLCTSAPGSIVGSDLSDADAAPTKGNEARSCLRSPRAVIVFIYWRRSLNEGSYVTVGISRNTGQVSCQVYARAIWSTYIYLYILFYVF